MSIGLDAAARDDEERDELAYVLGQRVLAREALSQQLADLQMVRTDQTADQAHQSLEYLALTDQRLRDLLDIEQDDLVEVAQPHAAGEIEAALLAEETWFDGDLARSLGF